MKVEIDKSKVHENEIPEFITVHLGMNERALFARILNMSGIGIENVEDTFEFILKRGLDMYYKEKHMRYIENHYEM